MTAHQRKPQMTHEPVIDFIFKPFDRDVLLAKIRGVFGREPGQGRPSCLPKWATTHTRVAHANAGVPDTSAGRQCRFFVCGGTDAVVA